MENVGGTEVISRAPEVFFVAGHLLDDLLHCNSRRCAAGRMRPLLLQETEDARTCALHARAARLPLQG